MFRKAYQTPVTTVLTNVVKYNNMYRWDHVIVLVDPDQLQLIL